MTTLASRLHPIVLDLLGSIAPTLLINLVCAIVVTYLMDVNADFQTNLIFSMCIGSTAMLLTNGGRLLLWGKPAPHKTGLLFILLALALLSFIIGSLLANHLLNQSVNLFTLSPANKITGFTVLTMLACASSTLFFRRREKMAIRKAHDAIIEKQIVQTQLQMLQAQIEPHMLFNTLGMLQNLIHNEPLRAQHMLDQLIHYLRTTLSTACNAYTTLEQEFELTKAYLGLMSLRMGMHLTYSLQLPDALREIPIAPMLLQPLVENAIKHGLETKTEGGNCTIRATRYHNMLILSVIDTGIGLATSSSYNRADSIHLGLANIRARLDALYGPLAELTLTHNIPAGAVAQLCIPINEKHEE